MFKKLQKVFENPLFQVQLAQSVSVPALVTGIWPTMGKTVSVTMGSVAIQTSSLVWMETVCPSAGSVMATKTARMDQMNLRECVVSNKQFIFVMFFLLYLKHADVTLKYTLTLSTSALGNLTLSQISMNDKFFQNTTPIQNCYSEAVFSICY